MAKQINFAVTPTITSIIIPITVMIKDDKGRDAALPIRIRGYFHPISGDVKAEVMEDSGISRLSAEMGGDPFMRYLRGIAIVAICSARKICRDRWVGVEDALHRAK